MAVGLWLLTSTWWTWRFRDGTRDEMLLPNKRKYWPRQFVNIHSIICRWNQRAYIKMHPATSRMNTEYNQSENVKKKAPIYKNVMANLSWISEVWKQVADCSHWGGQSHRVQYALMKGAAGIRSALPECMRRLQKGCDGKMRQIYPCGPNNGFRINTAERQLPNFLWTCLCIPVWRTHTPVVSALPPAVWGTSLSRFNVIGHPRLLISLFTGCLALWDFSDRQQSHDEHEIQG